jgi:hypothetical protein
MSPHLIEKKIHCPERCKKNIMSPHLIEKKKYIVLKDVKKKNQKNLTLQFQTKPFWSN